MPLRVKKSGCTGCKLCELACSGHHEGVFNPVKARIRFDHEYKDTGIFIGAHYCNLCLKCEETCESGAISNNGKWMLVDHDKCISCGTCAETCPLDAVHYNEEKKSVICDFCEGDPQCIQWCPKDVIFIKAKKTQEGRAANE